MPWQKQELDVFLRRNVIPRINSNFATTKPLLWAMLGQDKAELDKLGDPNTGLMFGGRDLFGESTKRQKLGSEKVELLYQTDQTDPAETRSYRGNTPTATVWSEDLTGTSEFHWSDYWGAFRFGQDSLDMLQGSGNAVEGIQSITEIAMMAGMQRILEKVNTDLLKGSLTLAQQNQRLWPSMLGIEHQVSDGVTDSADYKILGKVDRTAQTELQARVKDVSAEVSAGNLPDSKIRLNLVRKAKLTYGLTKNFAGAGTFGITGPEAFEVLVEEAEARNLRILDGDDLTEVGMNGFGLPIIKQGNTFITYDPQMDDTDFYILTPRSWTFEVASGANFQLEDTIHEKWRDEEGGGYYNWGNIRAKIRLMCHEPWNQFKFTNLTLDGS